MSFDLASLPIKAMSAGAVVGVLRSRLAPLFGAATARGLGL
jgi:hypothetical protein